MDNSLYKHLRDILLRDWQYNRQYVDAAIRDAYRILKVWKRGYVRGDVSRERPTIKRRYAKVKSNTYTYKNGIIRISVKPNEFFEVDVSREWFWSRLPRNARMGELILREGWMTLSFKVPRDKREPRDVIGWDLNVGSMDGFNPDLGWIRVDLRRLFHIHRFYEIKRRMYMGEQPWIRRCWEKYSRRERNRSKDFIEKVTTEISRRFGEYMQVFEDIDKAGMINGYRAHNREINKMGWKTIIKRLSDKACVARPIDSRYTSQTCPRCGSRNNPNGEDYTCNRCGLKMNRQLVGAINVYMKFKSIEPSPETFEELARNIGDRPNIFIDIFPRNRNDKIHHQPALVTTPNRPSPLNVGLSPLSLRVGRVLPERGRGSDKAPDEPKKGPERYEAQRTHE